MIKKIPTYSFTCVAAFIFSLTAAHSENLQTYHVPETLQKYINHIADTHHAMTFIAIQEDIAAESVEEAKKGWRPQIAAQGYVGRTRTDSDVTNERFKTTAKFHQFTLSQPVYSGDRITSGIRLAKSQMKETIHQKNGDI